MHTKLSTREGKEVINVSKNKPKDNFSDVIYTNKLFFRFVCSVLFFSGKIKKWHGYEKVKSMGNFPCTNFKMYTLCSM